MGEFVKGLPFQAGESICLAIEQAPLLHSANHGRTESAANAQILAVPKISPGRLALLPLPCTSLVRVIELQKFCLVYYCKIKRPVGSDSFADFELLGKGLVRLFTLVHLNPELTQLVRWNQKLSRGSIAELFGIVICRLQSLEV